MAYGVPDGLWLPLLIIIIVILYILWNDSTQDPPPPPPEDEEGPSVSMRETRGSSHTIGETFALRGRYDEGDGTISSRTLTMNGTDIGSKLSSWGSGSFRTEEITVPDTEEVKCEIEVETQYGEADAKVDFEPSGEDEPEGPGLDVRVETTNSDPGESNGSVEITASPERGDADIVGTEINVPDLNRSENASGQRDCNLRVNDLAPGRYRYVAETRDQNGKKATEGSRFQIRANETEEHRLNVEASYNILSHDDGHVVLEAEVQEASNDVIGTSVKMKPVQGDEDDWYGDNSDQPRVEYELQGLDNDTYEYEGKAVDSEHNVDTDGGTFEIGIGDGPGGGSEGDIPDYINIFNQNTNNNIGNVPPELFQLLQDIVQETGGHDDTGDVTQQVGMDAYQLLLALSVLEPDLSSGDNQEIISELKQIRQSVEQNQISQDELENALKMVLHDIFGADLQNVLQGLDIDGFDEDKIVQAIRSNKVDIGPLVQRLSDIEQVLQQAQSQGGDYSDIEAKLDRIEDAIRDSHIDDQLMQQFISQINSMDSSGDVDVDVDVEGGMDEAAMLRLMDDIRDSGDPGNEMNKVIEVIKEQGRLNRELLRELIEEEEDDDGRGRRGIDPTNMMKDPDDSGEEGNKNDEDDNDGMPEEIEEVERRMDPTIQKEIEDLEKEYNELERLVELQGDIGSAEELLQEDVEEVVKHLKKAKQYEHHLADHVGNKKNAQQTAEKLDHTVEQIRGQINQAQRAIEEFKKDFSNLKKRVEDQRQLVKQTEKVEGQIEDQEEKLEHLEEVLERSIRRFEDSGLNVDEYNG